MISTQAYQPKQAASVYNDVSGLQDINKLGKQDKNAALKEVAKQFESMFLKMMLSSMRDANAVFKEDSLFSSSESDFYEKMYDDQITLSMSTSQSTGLAEVIYRQMLSNYGQSDNKPELKQGDFRRHDSRLADTLKQVDEALSSLPESLASGNNATGNNAAENDAAENDAAENDASTVTASGKGGKGQQFATPAAFVAALYPHAQQVGAQLNVDPKAIVAQAALETGWGKHMISDQQGNNSFNFFGIKADQRWQGERVNIVTHEYRAGVRVNERADFRSYASIEQGLADYASFLSSGSRYQQAIGKGLAADQYGHALQQAGYATDPAYGDKIHRVSAGETLNQALQQLQSGNRNL